VPVLKLPEDGVPNTGVVSVGLVKVLFVRVSAPVRVAYVLVSNAQELAAVFFKNPLVPANAPMAVKSASLDCNPATEVYNSVKLALVLVNAVRNGSPVPSLTAEPIPIVCCAIYISLSCVYCCCLICTI